MTIELTPQQQRFVEAQIAADTFKEPCDLIDAAMQLLKSRQMEYDRLHVAIEQDRHGDYDRLDLEDIKVRGRERLAAKKQ